MKTRQSANTLMLQSSLEDPIDVPVEGLSPNWTICRKLTPVAGKLE